jgi:predicted restriction endonuclease
MKLIVNEGIRRALEELGKGKSTVKLRKLDQADWFVHSYDDVSGDCLLVRGIAGSGVATVAAEASSEPEAAELLRAAQQPAVIPVAPPPAVPAYVDQFSEPTAVAQREVTVMVRDRSAAVRERVLRRACGVCELCGEPGFATAAGSIYLETHHVIPLSREGPDHDSNVVALCPNDHRRAHFGTDRDALAGHLQALVLTKVVPCH